MKRIMIGVCVAGALVGAALLLQLPDGESATGTSGDSGRTAPDSPGATARDSGGTFRRTGDGFSGCGWSTDPDTRRALAAALDHALGDSRDRPDLTFVFYNPQHDPELVESALAGAPRPTGRVLGLTTHEGILSADGYHRSKRGVLGVLSVRTPGMRIGVGGARFDSASPADATRVALRRAIEDAGEAEEDARPTMIVLAVTLPHEEEVLDALAEETGPDVPLIGGTAAGSVDQLSRKKVSNWSVLAGGEVLHDGVGIAVFYAPEKLAWSYGGGYRRTKNSGIVTRCEPRLILEIDGRPAVEVYDEWMGGRLSEARDRGENLVNFCSLYPLCTSANSTNRFVRAWPSEDPRAPGSLRTGSNILRGEEVFLSEGTWNILLNHFGTVPKRAVDAIEGFRPRAGIFLYCGGALACIPEDARPQMSSLVRNSLGDIPWLGVFTWGEQGNIRGVGNRHSNLSAGTLLLPESAYRR